MQQPKLIYRWVGKSVLEAYGTGEVVVLASSLAEARQLVRDNFVGLTDQEWRDPKDEGDQADLARQMAFLDRDPEVYDTCDSEDCIITFMWGSD